MKLQYSSEVKNGKKYYFITLNNMGLTDKVVSKLFHVTLKEYLDIIIAMGGYEEDNRGYIFDTEEEIINAVVTLKMFLNEP